MRFIFSILAVLTLGLGVLTACQDGASTTVKTEASKPTDSPAAPAPAAPTAAAAPQADEHGHQDNAPRITLADAKRDFDAGKAIFIDTRSADAYNLEHIKGAINITLNDVNTRYTEIPKDKKIIVYCS